MSARKGKDLRAETRHRRKALLRPCNRLRTGKVRKGYGLRGLGEGPRDHADRLRRDYAMTLSEVARRKGRSIERVVVLLDLAVTPAAHCADRFRERVVPGVRGRVADRLRAVVLQRCELRNARPSLVGGVQVCELWATCASARGEIAFPLYRRG